MEKMSDSLKKTFERNFIYSTAPKCPFCGGTMLPLSYLVDIEDYRAPYAWRYDDVSGKLKACDSCGIVKFYPDTKE